MTYLNHGSNERATTTVSHSISIYVVVIAIVLGLLSLFLNIYPWWYVNKEGKKAGLDDFTISQWRWKALWVGWFAIFSFKKYLKTQHDNNIPQMKSPDVKTLKYFQRLMYCVF